jgi:hypothetical protein
MSKYITMEVARVLYQLPSDLSPLIRSFLCETRKDWRTCRRHEARLIRDFNDWTNRVLKDETVTWYYPGIFMSFPIIFSQDELDLYLEWTMFGRWFLILRTREDLYWSETQTEPHDHPFEYPSWYLREFRWFHNRWAF